MLMFCLGTELDLCSPGWPTTHCAASGCLWALFSCLSLLGAGLKVVPPHQAQAVMLFILTVPLDGKHTVLIWIKASSFPPWLIWKHILYLAQAPSQEIESVSWVNQSHSNPLLMGLSVGQAVSSTLSTGGTAHVYYRQRGRHEQLLWGPGLPPSVREVILPLSSSSLNHSLGTCCLHVLLTRQPQSKGLKASLYTGLS